MTSHFINPQIIIIGAGLAGLTAAYRLQERGYDVHVYEARQRPGGRVLSVKVGDSYDELGGKNFNDLSPDHSLKLMQDLGLEPWYTQKPYKPHWVNGSYSTPLFEVLKKLIPGEELLARLKKSATQSRNLQEVIESTFDDRNIQHYSTALIQMYEGSLPRQLDSYSFDTLNDLLAMNLEKTKQEENGIKSTITFLTLKGGNAQLPIRLSENLKNKIHYGRALTSLHKNEKNVTLTFNKSQSIPADIVLLAIPCSVFDDIDFGVETLPSEQLLHMKSLHYGTNGKILVPVQLSQAPFDFILTPDCFYWSNEDDRVITNYYGGPSGIFDSQKVNDLFKQGIDVLKNANPNVVVNAQTIEPSDDSQYTSYHGAVYKSWTLDPYAKGSYSNRAPGTIRWLNEIETVKGEQVRKAFSPVFDKLFFAGEHTTILETLGTMEGAIESGERMARLIDTTIKS